jgi:predicted hydrocarbon binding protein
MAKFEPKFEYDKARNLHYVEGTSMALHCHHYLGGFMRMVSSVDYVDGKKILYEAGKGSIRGHLRVYFLRHKELATPQSRLEVAIDAFRRFGLGILDFKECTVDGGIVKVPSSHVTKVLKEKIGKAESKIGSALTAGLIAGIMDAVFGKNYNVSEEEAFVGGTDTFTFKVEVL